MTDIYELILRTPDGRERRMAAYIPNDTVRQDYIAAAHKKGLEIEMREFNENEKRIMKLTSEQAKKVATMMLRGANYIIDDDTDESYIYMPAIADKSDDRAYNEKLIAAELKEMLAPYDVEMDEENHDYYLLLPGSEGPVIYTGMQPLLDAQGAFHETCHYRDGKGNAYKFESGEIYKRKDKPGYNWAGHLSIPLDVAVALIPDDK